MRKLFALALLNILLCLPVAAQSDKDIIRTHDKYTDADFISAKTNDVLARASGLLSAASMTPVASIKSSGQVTHVFLVFSPNTVTFAGGAQQNAVRPMKLYFQPNAEVILLINNERFSLPPAEKIGGLSGMGQYRDQAITAIPVDWFYKLAASSVWTIKIGDVVVGVGDPDMTNPKNAERWAERVQPRLRAFADEVRKINSARSGDSPLSAQPVAKPTGENPGKPALQSAAPGRTVETMPEPKPAPAKKACYEGGRKVACPN